MIISPVYNIVNSILNPETINVVYDSHNSAYDLIINSLDFNFFSSDNLSYDGLWRNLWISNNPLEFSQKSINLANDNHINSVLFFHDIPPKQFKKEDLLILKKHIQTKHKVLCSSSLTSSWLPSDNNWSVIEYGIPDLGPANEQKSNNLVVLNFNNNSMINTTYDTIKKHIPNTVMLTKKPSDIDSLYSILQDSVMCLNFEHYINDLVAAVCECFVITVNNTNLTQAAKISDINEVSLIVNKNLNFVDSNKILEQKRQVLDQYSFDLFSHRISILFQSIIKEKFIL